MVGFCRYYGEATSVGGARPKHDGPLEVCPHRAIGVVMPAAVIVPIYRQELAVSSVVLSKITIPPEGLVEFLRTYFKYDSMVNSKRNFSSSVLALDAEVFL